MIHFEESFTCPVCLQLAKQAVQTECCAKIYCETCIQDIKKKFNECPCCRSKALAWHPSRIARKVPCQFCENKVESGNMEAHLGKCHRVPLQCRLCKANVLQGEMPKHTANLHQKQAKEYLISYALGTKQKSESKVSHIPKANNPLGVFGVQKNRAGLDAALGSVAKYYCGGTLIGNCNCCDGGCGPDNGENCDACMQLDVQRWKLDKGYLVNTGGFVCQVLRVQGVPKVSCFRSFQTKNSSNIFGSGSIFSSHKSFTQCKPGSPCRECAQVENSIRIGRYVGLY